MLFYLEMDEGSVISAYVVPDTGGTTPSVRLRSNGAEILTLAANNKRENLVEAGRHSTGQCGFYIDDTVVPGLADYTDLEITETSSNVLIYRRRPPRAVDSNILRLETHLLPLWRLDEALRDRFQYWYYGVDRFGRETSTQVFCLEAPSMYISGRLLYKNFEYYLTKGMKTIGLIRDPYHELAERLVLLKNIGTRAEDILGARDALTFAPVIAALQEHDLADDASCKRFFKRAPGDVIVALSNPLVRQLTAGSPDQLPTASAVASALDALASFEVLGLRSDPSSFVEMLSHIVEIDPAEVPRLGEYPRIAEFGERLRSIPAIEEFLEKDLEVFQVITQAFKSAGAHAVQ